MKLTGENRIKFLLGAIPYYRERQYGGNYYDNDDLNDIEDAISRAGLTEKQYQVIALLFVKDMSQSAVAIHLGITQPTVNRHVDKAVAKITEAYEKGKYDELK